MDRKTDNRNIPAGLQGLLEAQMDRAEAHKKRKRRLSVSAAALVLAMGLVMPNTTPQISQALSGIPVIGNAFSVVTVRDFEQDSGSFIADVEIPYIVAESPEAQAEADRINAEIDASLGDAIADFEAAREAYGGQGYGELLAEGSIVSDGRDYFTLKVTTYSSGADGFLQDDCYTIDKSTGKRVMLADVYGAGCESAIYDDVVRQMKTAMDEDGSKEYFVGDDGLTEIGTDQDFYINEEGDPVICFDEAEVAPAYMGSPEFTVHL